MKRLTVAITLFLTLVLLCQVHMLYLTHFTQDLHWELTQAQLAQSVGQWEVAYERTRQAHAQWDAHDFYLHTTLHHQDIDTITMEFQEVLSILQQQEQPGEYAAANARLMEALYLLSEAEVPSLKNIL